MEQKAEGLEVSKKPDVSTKTEISEYQKSIITVKEARKILGKKVSDGLSDEEVGRLIGSMTFLANRLLDTRIVPQNQQLAV